MAKESGATGRGLDAYRGKRAAGRTPEPFGGATRPHLFVVQQHHARRMHWDFRLEWRGVLLSWAVPHGPSLDPTQKRLAVHVEDHPVDYADFEGVIPEGNYGAGAVIVWDTGRWTPVEDPAKGLENGKLLFDLSGFKLRGRWTLVRTGGKRRAAESKEWLLIKKPDAYAEGDAELDAHSVLSGLTVDELRTGADREERLTQEAAELGARRRRISLSDVKPMLPEACDKPFSGSQWLFEVKYDGYRAIAERDGDHTKIRYRSGRDATSSWPEITTALNALPYSHIVVDGELVVHDAAGRPSFQRLQQRTQARGSHEIRAAAMELPATLFAFDILALGELDLRPLPLLQRKQVLEEAIPKRGPISLAPHFLSNGEAVFAEISKLGLEGMVAKRTDAPYRAGRSSLWRKIRIRPTHDFAIVGMSAARGSRTGFGALHLAAQSGDTLHYVGRVGSGFSDGQLKSLRRELEGLRRPDPACLGAPPSVRGDVWVEPQLVCEVQYTEVTHDGRLRQPVFLRLRDDKTPAEIDSLPALTPTSDEPSGGYAEMVPMEVAAPAVNRTVSFTHLEKLFWPEEHYSKGDLIAYYRAIAPWLLPYLRDRPLVLTRFPDGIHGKSFFQKDAPKWAPEWLRTETLWSEHGGRDIGYIICDDVDSLLYVVNLGTIPLHVWGSRVANLAHPDWCILDLDPKGAPFAHVVEIARALHATGKAIGLPTFVKTSGASGLHVLVPLGGRLTFEQARTLAELLARSVVDQLPKIGTTARPLRARGGRVYVDTGQNGHGRLLVSPFSARPFPGAPVSMPLRWSEVGPRLDPGRFTIRNALARMRRLGGDPLLPVLEAKSDLLGALERLLSQTGGGRDA